MSVSGTSTHFTQHMPTKAGRRWQSCWTAILDHGCHLIKIFKQRVLKRVWAESLFTLAPLQRPWKPPLELSKHSQDASKQRNVMINVCMAADFN